MLIYSLGDQLPGSENSAQEVISLDSPPIEFRETISAGSSPRANQVRAILNLVKSDQNSRTITTEFEPPELLVYTLAVKALMRGRFSTTTECLRYIAPVYHSSGAGTQWKITAHSRSHSALGDSTSVWCMALHEAHRRDGDVKRPYIHT